MFGRRKPVPKDQRTVPLTAYEQAIAARDQAVWTLSMRDKEIQRRNDAIADAKRAAAIAARLAQSGPEFAMYADYDGVRVSIDSGGGIVEGNTPRMFGPIVNPFGPDIARVGAIMLQQSAPSPAIGRRLP